MQPCLIYLHAISLVAHTPPSHRFAPRDTAFPRASAAALPQADVFSCGAAAGGNEAPYFLALPLPLCPRLMHLRVVLPLPLGSSRRLLPQTPPPPSSCARLPWTWPPPPTTSTSSRSSR